MLDVMKARFNKDPPISEYFPLELPEGITVPTLSTVCTNCQAEIELEDIHGIAGFVLDHVFSIDGHAVCYKCNTINPVLSRFRVDDNAFYQEHFTKKGWVKQKLLERPEPHISWVGKVLLWLKKHMMNDI